MPDIAVIIPTYNRAPLIPAALDSVIAQTAPGSFEVAVVDDGSTDITHEVMEPYLLRHGKPGGKVHITYTQLNKQGVVFARNHAIRHTTAPLVAFLDSDDYWGRRKIELQLGALQADPGVGVVHTSFRYVNEESKLVDDGPQRPDNPCHGSCLMTLLDEDLVIFSSVLMRRDVIDRIAEAEPHKLPFDPRWTNAQDYDLLLRAARVTKYAYLSEPLTFYRLHGGHGAMGNLRKAFGFHGRVQLDFARRHGAGTGITEEMAKEKVRSFLYGRAESMFWKRELKVARELIELARELGVGDARFEELDRRATKPRWVYQMKDGIDRVRGRGGKA